ncbi:hypothetical protein [Paenibacillus popilliae]|uniref:Uncharacterized protein n=1 Tax=Paenibacillus popilliae TaxID=78057 RepID=A0ABY3AVK0_PAEPP|nr:hypothetical protein [Paenibacillus sp. SDF0028]TQR46299.1 hypothetical protein C7Y44_01005 [Paenibacillus sp. SDF0028]
MNRTVSFGHKVHVLRGGETYGYQVAHYLLQEEELALDATKAALLELSSNDDFFAEASSLQRARLLRAVTRHALLLKQKRLRKEQGNIS